MIGGIYETQEIFDFCAEHGVASKHEHTKMDAR
jgi:D-arabinose 1-dehydrogenase-like Zn-dependent alcohol dehydrogenase